MTWITTISYEDASGALKKLYDRIKGPDNNVDNIMMAHSLRPHSMEGHMSLYKYVLHHPRNALPKSYLETIGVYVSLLNQCRYCIDHHYSGLIRLLQDDARATAIRSALDDKNPAAAFAGNAQIQQIRLIEHHRIQREGNYLDLRLLQTKAAAAWRSEAGFDLVRTPAITLIVIINGTHSSDIGDPQFLYRCQSDSLTGPVCHSTPARARL